MLFQNTVFIGIDPPSGSESITYAVIDKDRNLLALSRVDLNSLLAFIAGQQSAVVAINSPRRPNQGLMADGAVRAGLDPNPSPGRWMNFRVAEYQLFQANLRIPHTPARPGECPTWMQTGFSLYRKLAEFGFRDYKGENKTQMMLEVYPHAVFAALLERIPFKKKSLEGRLQRQLCLHAQDIAVPDPMKLFEEITRYRILQGIMPLEKLFQVENLEALAAAFTAWKTTLFPDQVTSIGDPREGEIVIPVQKLRARYS